ncbi:hypothetical protein [Paeniglutamicibacter sp.]|uniref:hypothetical protein n=1 Tax=Paeniglutamicibacter sp. TaxID=1934391 RepID=UPI003989444E
MAKTTTLTAADAAAYAQLACVYERGHLANDPAQRITFKTWKEDFPLEFLVKHLASQNLKTEEHWGEKGRVLLVEANHAASVTHALLRLDGIVLL